MSTGLSSIRIAWSSNSKEKVKKIINDPNVIVWYKATKELLELIVSNIHPITSKIAPSLKKILLEGNGFAINKELVFKYLDSTLDEKHTFLFENGDLMISIINENISDGISKQIINIKKDILEKN